MKKIKRKEKEGAMGVGTLIVFIALVLVAAVASSVLIDTANQLQQQAEKTGDQAISEVSSSFLVHDITGENEVGEDGLDNITLKIGLSAGARPQNLEQTVLQLKSPDWEVNLQAADYTENDAGSEIATEENYSWEQIILQEDSVKERDKPIVRSGDLYAIIIDLRVLKLNEGVDSGEGPLYAQDELDIKMIPKHGTPSLEHIVAPPVAANDVIDL